VTTKRKIHCGEHRQLTHMIVSFDCQLGLWIQAQNSTWNTTPTFPCTTDCC